MSTEENAFSVEPFEGLRLTNLSSFFPNEEKALELCIKVGLVPSPDCEDHLPKCPRCSGPTCVVKQLSSKSGFIYRCASFKKPILKRRRYGGHVKKAMCNGTISPAVNSWFDGLRLPIVTVLNLMFLWVLQIKVTVATEECGISCETAVKFYSYCREVTEIIVSHLPLQIGGPGLHVEVGEKFTRRWKYHQGRTTRVRIVTLFGIYCKETQEGMYWQVQNKSNRVLWRHIERYVAPGSIIISCYAPTYKNCEQELGFSKHLTVNHSQKDKERYINLDNPEAHTKNIRYVKKTAKSLRNNTILQHYICEHLYRNRILKRYRHSDAKFRQFVGDVATVYPGPGREPLELGAIGVDVSINEPGFNIPMDKTITTSDTETTEFVSESESDDRENPE